MVYYVGIETSCDDTAVALMKNEKCLANEIVTHNFSDFGGVVPEYASREHMSILPNLLDNILNKHNLSLTDLSFISATKGPGLLGSLMVGVQYSKSLAWGLSIPFIGVHHLEAHALIAKWNSNLEFPFGILLVSGGHTCIVLAREFGKYEILGHSIDDAVGEMLDKVGRCLGFENPAGPHMEQCAKNSNNPVKFTEPLRNDGSMNFSFSGLKTAAMRFWESSDKSEQVKSDLCLGLQQVIVKSIASRLKNTWDKYEVKSWVFAGGVASNLYIRSHLTDLCDEYGKDIFIPDPKLCRDNGMMIGYTGYLYYQKGMFSSYNMRPVPDYKIDQIDVSA
ncbi:tRNA (adenosine(37)-N6)-threonylcarbamoyltransferase complex transferase subunit TsaD [Candidatus Cytomitobacter indipagum]|uniref:tRNA N6-adenosine threonylcarbamoyltransferase n=1 Tax=Candidatus Cytomitobacter indipagum TaxID=2601575 RepID=A0A5C0UEI9_9PROT|nr:tRNA (adenosine(37)-N6)-threonylcarbamoyltransferase complex transferase subunit TsaD [Candidatus Cytomitobacter indipagum]QEK38127.1 tRNA (adenosine(37)-N6)-threonylcarbamoyltransferase complex transferase subunit TsaD [Candidatus Cytomitobacter indipagum]